MDYNRQQLIIVNTPDSGLIYKEVARDRLKDPLATLQTEKVPIPDRLCMVQRWKDKIKLKMKTSISIPTFSKLPTTAKKLAIYTPELTKCCMPACNCMCCCIPVI